MNINSFLLGCSSNWKNGSGECPKSVFRVRLTLFSLEEMRTQLVKERDELLAQGQQRQSKEEDWDKRTETLAKAWKIPFCPHSLY
jgi:hypothetical protein